MQISCIYIQLSQERIHFCYCKSNQNPKAGDIIGLRWQTTVFLKGHVKLPSNLICTIYSQPWSKNLSLAVESAQNTRQLIAQTKWVIYTIPLPEPKIHHEIRLEIM